MLILDNTIPHLHADSNEPEGMESNLRKTTMLVLAASLVVPILSYLLSFAAGAMVYVVVEELIPEMSAGVRKSTDIL